MNVSSALKGAFSSVQRVFGQCFGCGADRESEREVERLSSMDALLHKALSPTRKALKPLDNAEGQEQKRPAKDVSRPSGSSILQKALVKLGKAKAAPSNTVENPEGPYFPLPASQGPVLSPLGPLQRIPGLENHVPQPKAGRGAGGKPALSVRKQLEEALRHYARLQQELILEQGAASKKEHQVRELTRNNEELRLKVSVLEKTVDGVHAGYRSQMLVLENALQDAKNQNFEGVAALLAESASAAAATDDAAALEEARARISQLEKELHDSIQMALLPPTAPFPPCGCRVDRLVEEEARTLKAAALARLASGGIPDTMTPGMLSDPMSEPEKEMLLYEAIKQERLATVVHMKDKFWQSEAKRKRAEEKCEQYKKHLHDLEQQLHVTGEEPTGSPCPAPEVLLDCGVKKGTFDVERFNGLTDRQRRKQ